MPPPLADAAIDDWQAFDTLSPLRYFATLITPFHFGLPITPIFSFWLRFHYASWFSSPPLQIIAITLDDCYASTPIPFISALPFFRRLD
jgi:hypothetical protein